MAIYYWPHVKLKESLYLLIMNDLGNIWECCYTNKAELQLKSTMKLG